jgi:multiple sugar transport system ATP-binding protein
VSLTNVRLHDIHKRFGASAVLNGLDLNVEAGEFLVILGPSGCGKSTLLNIVAGLEKAGRGRVLIGDRDVTHLEPRERNVAMVFQTFALYPTMSVRRNIGFSLAMAGMPAQETAKRVDEIARLLHLENILDRRPALLSGGQQQRVAMGRALVRRPAALLLDEPLSNLDAKLRAELRAELKRLHAKTERTTLYVTHDQLEAMTLATRIAVLNDGQIQQCDRPQVIYSRPASRFVASFIGTPMMTFIPGRLSCIRDTLSLSVSTGAQLPMPGLTCSSSLMSGADLLVGFRPEHLALVAPGDEASVSGQVSSVESTGPDIYAAISVAGHTMTARAPAHVSLRRGQEIAIRIDGSAVSLFDPQSGLRLN